MAKKKKNIRKIYKSNGSFHIRIPMALIRKAKVKHNDFFDFELKNGELILKKVKL